MIPCLFSPINSSKSPSVLQRSLFLATYFDFLPFSPMESFALLKFWKTSTARVAGYGDTPPAAASADDGKCLVSVVDGGEEEEESFFELEFTLPDCDEKSDCKEEKTAEKIGRIGDFISDEKPDARISSKPQSPMSILRQSAPKLRVFMLGKLIKKSKQEKASQTQSISTAATAGGASAVPEAKTKINFTVKLMIEDATDLKKRFSCSDSSRNTERRNSNGGEDRELYRSSRRFSKDSVNKYINLIKKPLYVKLASTTSSSKRPNDRRDRSGCASTASFASPRKSEDRANSMFRAPCKNLAKSRSAGALLVGVSSPLKDDSLTQQNDGIQGAILHCKQSFNSSPKERRVMSRSASDTSHDKSIQRSTDE